MSAGDGFDAPLGSRLVELQKTLYESRNPTRRWLHRSRRAWVESTLRRLARERPSRRVLDVGPGSGIYLSVLSELFDNVIASDIHDTYLEHVRATSGELPNLSVIIDDITDTRLAAASFDLVLCSEVIEHTPNPAAALAGVHSLLRPGGLLLLTTPQRYSPIELAGRVAFLPGVIKLVRAIYREPILPTGHISLLSAKQLRRLIEARGFRVLAHEASGLYLPLIAELGGARGVRLEGWLEGRIARGPLAWLLWTQYWVVERPPQ